VSRGVAITGIGLVTPLGVTFDGTVAALIEGARAARRPTMFDLDGFSAHVAAEVPDFDARPWFRVPKALKLTDRQTRLGVAAAAQSLAHAAWSETPEARENLGVVIGTSAGDLIAPDLARALRALEPNDVEDVSRFGRAMLDSLNPLWGLINLPNMPSAHAAIQLGVRGPNSTIMSGWTAGLAAISEARHWVLAGDVSAALAGGADSALHAFAFACLEQAGLLTLGPDHFLPGEAGAVFTLEDAGTFETRGTLPLAYIASSSTTAGRADVDGLTDSLARAIHRVVVEAEWSLDEVDLVVSAAGSVPMLADAERGALERVFTSAAPATVSWTAQVGHALGASGAVATALALSPMAPGWGRAIIVATDPSGSTAALGLERPRKDIDGDFPSRH
jgi:3-oxoacyl-[acyl-carrier-protein] synthase II